MQHQDADPDVRQQHHHDTGSEGIRYLTDDDVARAGPGSAVRIAGITFGNNGTVDTSDSIVMISQDPGTDVCTPFSGNTSVEGITLQQSLAAVLQIAQASTAALAAANGGATVATSGTTPSVARARTAIAEQPLGLAVESVLPAAPFGGGAGWHRAANSPREERATVSWRFAEHRHDALIRPPRPMAIRGALVDCCQDAHARAVVVRTGMKTSVALRTGAVQRVAQPLRHAPRRLPRQIQTERAAHRQRFGA